MPAMNPGAAPGPYSSRTRCWPPPRPTLPTPGICSCVWSWLSDPQRFGVITGSEPADRIESVPIPHVLGVVPRPDPLHEAVDVIGVERGRPRETAEELLAARRIDVRIVIAAHIHPQLVVSPPPQRDVLLRHDV